MMKILRKTGWLAALLIAGCLAVACGDDDVIERPDKTKVTYKLELGTGWLQLYNVTVDYRTADGQLKSTTLQEDKWEYEDEVDGRYTKFTFIVTAKAKRTTFDASDPEVAALLAKDKDLTYSYDYYYYEKETSAHRINPGEQGSVLNAGNIASYVASHPEIKILEHDIQVK